MKNQDWKLWIHYHYYLARAVLIVGAGVLLVMIGILPMINKLMGTQKRLKQEKAKLEELTNKIVIVDNLDPNIVEQRAKLLDGVLPPSKDVVRYLNTLNALTKELNLSLGDVTLSPGVVYQEQTKQKKSKIKVAKKGETWRNLETEIRIIGSKDNIYTFLKQIENIAPLMVMKDAQISRVNQGSDASFVLSLKLGMVYAEPDFNSIVKRQISLLNSEDEKLFDKLKLLKSYSVDQQNNYNPTGNNLRNDIFQSGISVRSKLTNQSLPLPVESSQSAQSSPAAQLKE